MTTYDTIGAGYARNRQPDPRWQATITRCLGDARTVLNVGAGAGSYEPVDRAVIAVEPSRLMIAQRPAGAAPVVQGVGETLPFHDFSFDVAMAVLTVHHWRDYARGLAELRRIARRHVIVTWDPTVVRQFWLVREYLPEIMVRERHLPTVRDIAEQLDVRDTLVLPVAHDCSDGVMGAYWRRPRAYLDRPCALPSPGSPCSTPLWSITRMARLDADLRSGAWLAKHAPLLEVDELDLGYRLLVAGT